jgi:hypothetical protein
VSRSSEATDASIGEEPRMGLGLSYLRYGWPRKQPGLHGRAKSIPFHNATLGCIATDLMHIVLDQKLIMPKNYVEI